MITRTLITGGTPLPIASPVGGVREAVLIRIAGIGMVLLPAQAVATPFLDVARHDQGAAVLALGACLALPGLWLFWRSHADLAAHWSPALELREAHALVMRDV